MNDKRTTMRAEPADDVSSHGDDDEPGPLPPSDNSKMRVLGEMVAHKKWLGGLEGGHRGSLGHIDLSGWTLEGIDFSRADLRGTTLAKAVLRNSVFDNADLFLANLEGADLRRASLKGANLAGARLNGADLRDADLSGTTLGRGMVTPDTRRTGLPSQDLPLGEQSSELRTANLERAMLARADLSHADLTGANLSGANLDGATLCHANLSEANLENIRADGANFDGADLSEAALDPSLAARIGHRARAEPPEIDNDQALALHREWLDSGGRRGRQLNLVKQDLSGRDFAGLDLTAARMRRCVFTAAVMDGCVLRQADLSGSTFIDTSMKNVDLSGAAMRRALLQRTNLTNATLVTVEIDGRTWPMSLEQAVLYDLILAGATIRDTVMRETRVSTNTLKGLSLCGVPTLVLRRLMVEEPGDD